MSLSNLKKNRSKVFDEVSKRFETEGTKQSFKDERFWYPDRDKSGNGYAVIRFLPGTNDGLDQPWQAVYEHGFQGPTGLWYIEKSRTTLGKTTRDPVTDYTNKLWRTGNKADEDLARKYKRRLFYVSNVYVVEDAMKPENEGRVVLFKFGKRIYDKLKEANNPKFPDEKPIDPFDLWGGANFKLKIRKQDGQTNYDASSFADPAPLMKDEAKLEEIYSKAYDLKEFVDPKNFKSYDELAARFNLVMGWDESEKTNPTSKSKATVPVAEDSDAPWDVRPAEREEMGIPEIPEISNEDDEDFFGSMLAE